MPIYTTRVEVFESVIQTHFEPGGAVYKDAESVGRLAVKTAQGFAGRRTGRLQAGITYGRAPGGRLRYTITMKSSAPYSPFVNDGTLGKVIRAKTPTVRDPKTGRIISGGMHLPPYGAHGAKILDSVRGQYPKKFLQRGMSISLKRHGYPGL